MGFLSKDSNRDLGVKAEFHACEAVAAVLHGAIADKRESPDFTLETPVGSLGLEVTSLTPPPQVVAANLDGFKLLDLMYEAWLAHSHLQNLSISVNFLPKHGNSFKTPTRKHRQLLRDELVAVSNTMRSDIADEEHIKILFHKNPARTPKLHHHRILDSSAYPTAAHYIQSVLLRRHDCVRTLMPSSNLNFGPRGHWPARLSDIYKEKRDIAERYRDCLPQNCGLGLVVNTNTIHTGHFCGLDHELEHAVQILRRLHEDSPTFDCMFLTGPVYYGSDYQLVKIIQPWIGHQS